MSYKANNPHAIGGGQAYEGGKQKGRRIKKKKKSARVRANVKGGGSIESRAFQDMLNKNYGIDGHIAHVTLGQ